MTDLEERVAALEKAVRRIYKNNPLQRMVHLPDGMFCFEAMPFEEFMDLENKKNDE